MTIDGSDRSPYRYYGRSTFEPFPSDRDLLPKPTITRPSHERNPFGGQERGGAYGGVAHPDGPGPFPADFLDRSDIASLPWTRERGDEWTTPALRTAVFTWLRGIFRDRGERARLTGWQVEERATGRGFSPHRLPPRLQYLRIVLVQRVGCDGFRSVEVAQSFPPAERSGAPLLARLEVARISLVGQLTIG